ncbi:hypothetical protein ACOMHN_031643 [Nucella lapillus]
MNMNVNINKVGNMLSAESLHITNYQNSDRHPQSATQHAANGGPRGRSSGTPHRSFVYSDGGESPPESDTAAASHVQNDEELPVPTQTSTELREGERSEESTQQQDGQPAQQPSSPQLRTLIAVESSTDYISVGGERGQAGLNDAVMENCTAMSELKYPLPENPDAGAFANGQAGLNDAVMENCTAMSELKYPLPENPDAGAFANGQAGLNDAVMENCTAMSEMKYPLPENPDAGAFANDEESTEQFSFEDTELKQAAQHDHDAGQDTGDMNHKPHPATVLRLDFPNENTDSNLTTDAPELTPLNSSTPTGESESGAPLSGCSTTMLFQPSVGSMSSREDGSASREGRTSPREKKDDSTHAGEEEERLPEAMKHENVEGRHPDLLGSSMEREEEETGHSLPVSLGRQGEGTKRSLLGKGERQEEKTGHSLPVSLGRQGEDTKHSLPPCDSAARSLQTYGGERGGNDHPASAGQDLFVFIHRKMLVQDDDDPNVAVVNVSLNLNVLEGGEKEGFFPGGSSQLLQVKWFGHRDFDLSQWKLWPRSETLPDQTQAFIKRLCGIVKDWDIKCLRTAVKRLKLQHSVFLHSLTWEEGLVVRLGHVNPDVRGISMKSPAKDAIQGILHQLVSCCDVELAFQDPVPLEEEDTEDGNRPDQPQMESPVGSVGASDLSGSGQTPPARNMEYAQSSPSQQPASLETRFSPDQNSFGIADCKGSSLLQLLGEIIEENVSRMQTDRLSPHPELRESQEQLKQQLINLIECENKALEESVQELRRELEEYQSENRIKSQRLEAAEKREEEMTLLINQWRTQVPDHNKTIADLKRAARESEERMNQHRKMMEERLKIVEERSSQSQQDQTRALEETQSRMQAIMAEEMNKQMNTLQEQLKGMQQALTERTRHQEELSVTVEKHEHIFQHLSRSAQSGGNVLAMGELVPEDEETLGAVGGVALTRNRFSSALAESEQTTSKMQGKDEEMQSNQIEEKLHPLRTTMDSFGPAGSELQGMAAPSATEDASEEKPPTDDASPTVVSAQGGARSKTSPKAAQSETPAVARPNGAPVPGPGPGRKETSSTGGSQERTGNSTASEEPDENLLRAEQFLEWLEFSSSGPQEVMAKVLKNVSAALKDEEVPAPRAKCLDTILCIDVSDSIVSEGYLTTVKTTAMNFVDGIEDQMNEMDMEENLAVVSLAGNARVIQHLTNDLTLVREAIESLNAETCGGRSPFIQALLVCLAACKGRGGVLNIAGVYKVRPRIIFITDGWPTDETVETGPDLPGNVNETRFSLVHLLSQLASKKRKTTPKPISWVPIGRKADQKFMQSLADLTGGQLVMPDQIHSLCRYYKMQQMIGRLLKMVKKPDNDSVGNGKIRDLLNAMTSHTTSEEEKDYIVETVKRLKTSPEEEEDSEADDFRNVFEDEAKVKNGVLLSLGTRVVRGPHWKWKNQDTDGPGTVIQHGMKDNWMYVKWDNGTQNLYRYGEGGKTDIVETQHHPRQILPDSDKLDFGVKVIRGPDWKRDNEDGNGPGTVIRCREIDGKVKVRWDTTGKIHEYHYSKTKGREVQVNLPEFPRHSQSGGLSASHNIQPVDEDKTIAVWKWRDQLRQWRLYEEETCHKLEMEYKKRPGASCIINRIGKDRRVSFKLWQEKTVDGGFYTEVAREMVDEERKNDLLAIEMSLQE